MVDATLAGVVVDFAGARVGQFCPAAVGGFGDRGGAGGAAVGFNAEMVHAGHVQFFLLGLDKSQGDRTQTQFD